MATAQDGVVSLDQLRALGFGRGAIAHRRDRGRLHRIHPKVFAVGHRALTPRGQLIAAVLAAGPGAVVSHRSAAALWDLRPNGRLREDLIVPTHRRTPGLDLHRCRLTAVEVVELDGIPCTTAERTIVDLADVVPARQTGKAIVRGDQLRIVDFAILRAAVDDARGRLGHGALLAALADHAAEATMTRSELEERMFALLRRAHLPLPVVNGELTLDARKVVPDFLWPAHRLIAETDGFATHGTRHAFEDDRARDAACQVAGYRVVRFTWRQVRDEPQRVARTLRALL